MDNTECRLIGWLPPAKFEDRWYEISDVELVTVQEGDPNDTRFLKLVDNQRLYFAIPKSHQVNCGDVFVYGGFAIGTVCDVKKQKGRSKDKIITIIVDTALIKK